MTKGFSEVLMNPSQLLFKEQISELISSRLSIEKEIASYLINREFQQWQMRNRIFLCSLSLMPYEKKEGFVQECLSNLKQEILELIPEVSEFDERIGEIAVTSLNWLTEKCMICPRIENNDMVIIPE
ncbi:MAG: hypothetical protein ACFE8U_07925 [Candidatus Hermodarchaeota archaeon]